MLNEAIGQSGVLPLPDLQHQIAELLDKAVYRSENSYSVSQDLRQLAQEQQRAGAGEEAKRILARAQGVIGMMNCTRAGDPMHDKACGDLIKFKQEMRAGARTDD